MCRSCCSTPANTSFKGVVNGCNTGYVGVTVAIKTTGGTTLWTGTTTTGGNYSGSISLGANTAVNVVATAPNARFAASTTSITFTLVAGGSSTTNTLGILVMAVASGYLCTTQCNDPLATTLHLTSSGTCDGVAFPGDTLTWNPHLGGACAFGGSYYGTTHISYSGTSDYIYAFNSTGQLSIVSASNCNVVSVTNGNNPTSCPPSYLWQNACGVGGSVLSWGGSITE